MRWFIPGIVALAAVAATIRAVFALRNTSAETIAQAPAGSAELNFAAIVIGAIGTAVLVWRLFRDRRDALSPLGTALALRVLFYLLVAAAFVPTLLAALFRTDGTVPLPWAFDASLLLGTWFWLILGSMSPATFQAGPAKVVRAAELVLFNVLVSLVVLELAISMVQRFAPSPLLWNDGSVAATLDTFRAADGTEFIAYNSAGYHDDEFFAAEDGDYVVAVVTDSFGVGSVPKTYNFTYVAEEILRRNLESRFSRVAVHNFGVIVINMPEYVYLLNHEVPKVRPNQIVLCIFVGNDIGGYHVEVSPTVRRYRWKDWLTLRLTQRVARMWRGLEKTEPKRVTAAQRGEAVELDYLDDPSLEPPYFTEPEFLRIQSERFEFCNERDRGIDRRYERFFEALDDIVESIGDDLLLVVIPDELQVNDAVYEEVLATRNNPEAYDRDYPQKRIEAWSRTREVRVLDLLPALREAEAEGRTYHLRDTHWNSRGNRVAGEQLALALLQRLESGDRPGAVAE